MAEGPSANASLMSIHNGDNGIDNSVKKKTMQNISYFREFYMLFDFSHPMTTYESIAIGLALLSLIIPFLKWIYNNYYKKLKLLFYPNGQILLFFNQSGSYIRIYGVYESLNKASVIRLISVKITRKLDNTTLNHDWSCFISPIKQNLSNINYIDTTEIAHPIIFQKNSVVPLFIEFADPLSTSHSIITDNIKKVKIKIDEITRECSSYDNAYKVFVNSQEYKEAERSIEQEFLWKIGKYNIDINITHDNNKQTYFSYNFTITEQDYSNLKRNIHELIIFNLKQFYNQNLSLYISNITLYENK